MPEPLATPMPSVELGNGMTLTFEARSPTTGAEVADVTVSAVGIYAADLSGAGNASDLFGSPLLVPGPGA